ncbi:MAG: AAA family ATPase, partial [Planctomyces sp.]
METIEVEGRGHIGGLLITNQNGRPLEFQCTTPVRPNRTQEILFGETLRPWLLGELIGSTLLDRVAIKPSLVVTRDPGLLREEVPEDASRVVIDEVQKVPGLLDEVHWMIEHRGTHFALCGSSARKVRRGQANFLGGRAIGLELHGLVSAELGGDFDL